MTITTEPKVCLSCGKPLSGRADKKYCDDYCRNNFNNQLNSETNNFVRNVLNILRKNRRILEEVIPEGEELVKLNLDKLLQKGFNVKYHTHTYTNKKGDTYQFCFEFGYLLLENGAVLVVKRKPS